MFGHIVGLQEAYLVLRSTERTMIFLQALVHEARGDREDVDALRILLGRQICACVSAGCRAHAQPR